MNLRRVAGNAAAAFAAQGVALLVSMVTTLVVPKVLGVEEFGYWQLFVFYASYVGFFHLGLNDGVYLLNGGRTRADIDVRDVNGQMLMGFCVQSLPALAIVIFAFLGESGAERSFVLVSVAPYMLAKNTACYLGYLFQALDETRAWSASCVIERVAFVVPMLLLIVLRVEDFRFYVAAYLVATFIQLAYLIWHGRVLLARGSAPLGASFHSAIGSVRVGIKLMLANIASMLVLGVARASIDAAWGIEAFGQLSLTLSMVNFFLSFVTQAAMVLFPALRQVSGEGLRRFFALSRDLLSLLMPAVYLVYFPIAWLLAAWLPQYADSLIYLPYLLPICVFESKMSICCATYYKVARKEGEMLRLNVAVSIIGAIGSLFGAFVLHSVYAVILSTVLAIAGRSIWAEKAIAHELGLPVSFRIALGEVLITILFVVMSTLLPAFASSILYVSCYVVFLTLNRLRVGELIVGVHERLHD